MRHSKVKKMIKSLSLASLMLLGNTLPAFAMTGGTVGNTDQSTQIGTNISGYDMNQTQLSPTEQLQNLYLQKLKFDPKLLDSSNLLDLIVQFDVEPAQIQMLNQQKSGSAGINQLNTVTLESAEAAVNQTHSDFKSFINNVSRTLRATGETTPIKLGEEFTQVFNGVAVKLPKAALNDLLAQPYVKSVYQNVKYAPIPASQLIDAPASVTGDGKVSTEEKNPYLLPMLPRSTKQSASSTTSSSPAISTNEADPLAGTVPPPGPEGPQSGETAVLAWLKIHDLQLENITGKDVKVGVLDTGIDYNHPDLAGLYQGGSDFIDNDNDPMETVYPDWLAAKQANDALPPHQQNPNFPTDYRDYITSHGTHVAGTIAGQSRNTSPYALRGVAPEVQLYAYRVLGPHGGSDESVIGGIEQSYKDGCQVINLSLGAQVNDSLSPNAVAINNITDLGVTAVIAAGNAGPGAGTLGTPGAAAKAITVGAITYPKEVPTFDIHSLNSSGEASFAIVNTRLIGRDFTEADTKLSGATQYDLVDAGYGTPAWYDDLKTKNISVKDKVVVVKRGAAGVSQLMMYAAAEQAKAMILWNPTDIPGMLVDEQGYFPFYFGPQGGTVYTLQVNQNDGTKFYNAFKSGEIKKITVATAGNFKMGGNTLAGFSSTGPVTGSLAIKPDVVAPGVDIFSAAPYDIWEPTNTDYTNAYQTMSGTSMATPHVAGMAALILSAHPNYKPEDIKAALMQTADPIATQQSLFQIGSGKADPYQAVHTDMLFKVKDYIQSRSSTDSSSSSNIITVENTTASFSFGYKARSEDGSLTKTGDLYITNNSANAKTFDTSSVFFTTPFVKDGQDGAKEGAKISISDAVLPAQELTSINVPAGDTVHLIVKFHTPKEAASGYYEAYINFVNSAVASETYRIPLSIYIQSRGIDFRVQRKAITLSREKNFNPNTFAVLPVSWAEVRLKSPMDPLFGLKLYVLDLSGKNYIGFIGALNTNSFTLGDKKYVPFLFNGYYNPYPAPISKDDPNLTTKLTQQMSQQRQVEEGGYIIQARALDASSGQLYELNSSVYVDNEAPTLEMDAGSEPGIYEIDPNGPMIDGALKWFSGKAYDSNVDYMKDVGKETLVPAPPNYDTDTHVSQSLGRIDGMLGDSNSAPYVNYFLNLKDDGTFKFGVSKEDLVNTSADPMKENYGVLFRFFPEDYSFAGNMDTQAKYYYFVKKGNEYIINRYSRLESPGSTTLNGVDPQFLQDKTLVSNGDNFQSTLSVKYPKNLVGAKFYGGNLDFATITNVDFSSQYKAFLATKGITTDKNWIHRELDINGDFMFSFNLPDNLKAQGVLNKEDTMVGDVAQEMPLLDVQYKVTNDAGLDLMWPIWAGNIPEITTYQAGQTGMDRVPTVQDKFLYVRGGASVAGSIKPEGFQNYATANVYGRNNPLTASGSGIEVKFEDPNTGGITKVVQNAQDTTGGSNTLNQGIVQQGLFTDTLPMPAGTQPYKVTMKTPGHFTWYGTLTMTASGQFGYAAGGNYTVQSPVMLGGDVTGDNIIDMRDIQEECIAYNLYTSTPSVYTRAADINFNGMIDYADFEYIVKNIGKTNPTAPNAASLAGDVKTTTDADITLNGLGTIPSGSDINAFNTIVKPVPYLKTSDMNAFFHYGKVNPIQLFSAVYKTPDSNGATTLTQIDNAAYRAAIDGAGGQILIDGVDKKAATNVYNNVTQSSIQGKIVSNKGQYEFDPSLFQTAGVHTIVFKAPGYMDRSLKFNMLDGVGNTFSLLAPNNVNTIGKALTFSRSDGTGSTAAHYRDMWMPNITSITVTDPSNTVVKTFTGTELAELFNQVTPANLTTFNFTIPAGVFSSPSGVTDWKITIAADNYGTYTFNQRINAFSAPTLTAEANRYFNDSNSNPITIGVGSTNDTQAWRDAITAIQVGGTTIAKADFASKGITLGAPGTAISIDKSLITAPGMIKISVIAANYQTASVDQSFYKQGTALNKPAGTIYAGQDLVMTFAPGTAASEWITAVKSGGDIKFGGTAIKTRATIDETAGTLTIPADLVRTNGGSSASKSLTVSATGYADLNVNVTVTAQTAPVLTLTAPAGTPQYGDTITYTIDGPDNALWRSSLLLASTSDQVLDNGDVSIQYASVKPYVTTSVTDGKGSVTIDGFATQSNTVAGNKSIKFVSPYFAPITIAQPFVQRTAPTIALTPSGVGKAVIITVPNNTENLRWANAAKAVSGDILVGGVSVKADTTISSDDSNITIALPGTAFTATGDIEITIKAYCYPNTTVTQVVKSNPPVFASKIAYIQEDTPITINYEADAAWLAAAPVVSVNGNVVDSSKYTLSATELTFADRSLFNAIGNYKVTISAAGYMDTSFDIIVSDELMYLISVTADGTGSISPSGNVSVKHGNDQTFTITPWTGYEIDTVKVDGEEVTLTNNTYTFTNVKSNHTMNVTFKQIVHTITATAGEHGTISPSGSVPVNYGGEKTFTITPDSGYEVATVKVDGADVALMGNAYTFANVTSNHSIAVTFKQIVHSITAAAGEHGTIDPSGSVSVNHGDNQTFTIKPEKGYEVEAVTVDGAEVAVTNNSYTFTNVTSNHTIQVTFRPIPVIPGPTVHTITATAGKQGTISPSGDVKVINGSNQTFTFTPTRGYVIAVVKVDGVEVKVTNNSYTFTNVTSNHTIEVSFKDVTPPSVPVVKVVKDTDKKVIGKAESRSIVIVLVGTKVIGTARAGIDGNFAVVIPKQKAGTILKIVAKDAAGNTSKATSVTVIDKTPPAKPKVNIVKSSSVTVTGKAEAGSTVYVKVGSKVIGKATAGKDGKFTVKIAKKKAGTVLTVVAKDKAGNKSVAVKVTVVK